MADKTVLSGSKNCTYINPFNWDLYEIIQYKDRKCFTNDGKIIKWSDTFEMLKLFIKCCVNETGVWSAPGGKYKKFCSTSTDLALSWNYELGTLSFKGKVGDILKTLLTNICTDGKIASTKDRTLTDCDIPTKDKSLHDSHITPATSRTGVDSDSSEISFAQAIDNSTPLKSQPDCSLDTLQDQFSVFRQDMESKVLILLTKISEQT
jgi:hypothetical protein